jgi:hypothetical protein
MKGLCQEICVMVKLSPEVLHPLSPVSDQVPVIAPPEIKAVAVAVPVTVPLSVRILFPDCTV